MFCSCFNLFLILNAPKHPFNYPKYHEEIQASHAYVYFLWQSNKMLPTSDEI